MASISILALCYNHEDFLDKALGSLVSLPDDVEVIVVDDASKDKSPEILRRWQTRFPNWKFVFHKENMGNCRTFNELLRMSKGDWILDFATDDILFPDKLLDWVAVAESKPDCGFCYAEGLVFRDEAGPFKPYSQLRTQEEYPEGRILNRLFEPSFICPPAVLFSRGALERVGAYNESLAYEDFDVWLRIARKFPVYRFHEAVIAYRKHPDSMSASVNKKRNARLLDSTVQIFSTVMLWPELRPMPDPMLKFLRYHLRLCFYLQLPRQAQAFFQLLKDAGKNRGIDSVFCFMAGMPLPIYRLYSAQLWLREKVGL